MFHLESSYSYVLTLYLLNASMKCTEDCSVEIGLDKYVPNSYPLRERERQARSSSDGGGWCWRVARAKWLISISNEFQRMLKRDRLVLHIFLESGASMSVETCPHGCWKDIEYILQVIWILVIISEMRASTRTTFARRCTREGVVREGGGILIFIRMGLKVNSRDQIHTKCLLSVVFPVLQLRTKPHLSNFYMIMVPSGPRPLTTYFAWVGCCAVWIYAIDS